MPGTAVVCGLPVLEIGQSVWIDQSPSDHGWRLLQLPECHPSCQTERNLAQHTKERCADHLSEWLTHWIRNSYDTTYVYTNEGNTSSAPGVVANGGACRNKKYKLTDSAIDGYVWIDYGTTEDLKSTETAVQLSKVPKWVGMVNTAELNVRSWPAKRIQPSKNTRILHNIILLMCAIQSRLLMAVLGIMSVL